jgi:GTPase SAR1 family protein
MLTRDMFNNLPELFKTIKPIYSVLKVIPDTSIRNYDSENIARVICSMYSLPVDRIGFKDFQFSYRLPYKTSFFIDISIKGVSFFIITPEEYEQLITEKCSSTWPRATITKIDSIPMFTDKSVKYEMVYKKEDALSLKVDRKSNEPLNSIIRVMDMMEQDDRVGIYYNFMPGEQMAWKNKHRDTLEKVKKNVPIDKEKFTLSYIVKFLFEELMKLVVVIFDQFAEFIGGEGKSLLDETAVSQLGTNSFERLSESTLRKGDRNILDSQLIVLSDSSDEKRRKGNAVAVCESYKSISEDNSLVYKKYKKAVYYDEYKVKGAAVNTISTEEATNFFQIPGRTLLQQYPVIEKVDVLENPIPEELSKGYIYLGTSTYKGRDYPAYLRDEYNQGNLPLTLMGPQGSGKTTFIANYVRNAYNKNEAVILIDFIKNCELSTAIEKVIPKSALKVIDLSKSSDLQGLGYNEIKIDPNMDEYELLELSNLQAQQTMSLVDAINSEGLPLTSKMRRYLSSAANIVFLQENSNIRDVINCLQDFRKRAYYISKVPNGLREYLEDEINTLGELDEYTSVKDPDTKEVINEVTGTKDSKIDGILDRVNLLKEDAKLKYMFNKKLNDNIDLAKEVDKGKIILIKMPEIKFPLPYVKNVLVTYFTTKVWLTLQIRGAKYERPTRCHFIIDEIYQAPTCERILRDVLPQSRKFGGKFVISCHYLSQIEPIREALKASGSSFMLFQGTDKKNYEELKEELQPYELEDLLNIKQWHSLNLIKYEKGYARFITHLPLPV